MKKIGICADHFRGLREAEAFFGRAAESGFDVLEVALDCLPLITGGSINERMVNDLKALTEGYPLELTAHIGEELDLRRIEELELQYAVLESSIRICGRLGIHMLTVHFEEHSPIRKREEAFYQAYKKAAVLAGEQGVMLGMENIETEDYSYVLRMIESIDDANFAMTLDLGHLYLACNYFGGDYMEAVRECLPYVKHVHLSGNTGAFEPMRLLDFPRYKTWKINPRIAYGRGDIHVPPVLGNVPYDRVLPLFKDYEGIFLCEYPYETFENYHAEVQEMIRSFTA